MKSVLRPLIAALLASVVVCSTLLDSGCSRKDAELNDAIATIGGSGVGVYESYSANAPIQATHGPASAMKFTRWQLANLLASARAGSGFSGAELDRFGKNVPKRLPRFSYFVAGWLKGHKSHLAVYARTFMPKNANYANPSKLVYPMLVVALWVGDIARIPATAPAAARTGFELERLIAAPAVADGICSTVTQFIDSIINGVTDALKINGDSTIDFLWNSLVEVVVGVTVAFVKNLIAPILNVITAIAGAVSLITMVASTLQAWHLSMSADPPDKIEMGEQPVEGSFTATLDAPSIPFPTDVIDCGKQLGGVDLSQINFKDAPVDWETFGDIPGKADIVDKPTVIGDDKTSTLRYRTHALANVPKPGCSVEQFVGSVAARATVSRQDVVKLQQQLLKVLSTQLPDLVRPLILDLIAPWLDSATQSFANLTTSPVTATGSFVQLSEPSPDPSPPGCSPTPNPSSQPSTVPSGQPPQPKPSPSGGFDAGSFVGSWGCDEHVTIPNKELGPISLTVHTTWTFTKNGTVSTGAPADAHWSGPKSVYASKNQTHLGSGPYRYTQKTATTGVLTMDNKDEPVEWVDPHKWIGHLISPANNAHVTLVCTPD